MKNAQAWSLDLVVAVAIFVIVMTLFYSLLVREPKADINNLQREGKYISERLYLGSGGGNCSFIDGKYVDGQKLANCFHTNPEDFRKENNIKGKFCIYITDQKGKIITVDNRTGFGFPDLTVSGVPCGKWANGTLG